MPGTLSIGAKGEEVERKTRDPGYYGFERGSGAQRGDHPGRSRREEEMGVILKGNRQRSVRTEIAPIPDPAP
jgi:hypothetical protein